MPLIPWRGRGDRRPAIRCVARRGGFPRDVSTDSSSGSRLRSRSVVCSLGGASPRIRGPQFVPRVLAVVGVGGGVGFGPVEEVSHCRTSVSEGIGDHSQLGADHVGIGLEESDEDHPSPRDVLRRGGHRERLHLVHASPWTTPMSPTTYSASSPTP